MKTTKRHFTFGTEHTTSYPLPFGAALADYWVTVELPDTDEWAGRHREIFVREFTTDFCPRVMQFSGEYTDESLQPHYFPRGQLCTVTPEGAP